MINSSVYRDIKKWKKPIHISKSLAAKTYLKALRNVDVVAITGSVGKTLTQNTIYAVLSQKYKVAVGEENLDPTFRIPKTISKMAPWTQKLILEYGIEHPGDMDHYLNIAKPKISVITHIAPTHLKYFGSVHGVFDEKSKLISALPKDGYAILNADDPLVAKMANLTVAKILWFGKKAKDGIKTSHFKQNSSGSSFRIHYGGQQAFVNWKIIGAHHLTSAYAAATVGIASGLTVKQIAKGLSLTKQPEHRMQSISRGNLIVIDDTYNSSPKAAEHSIQTLVELGKNKFKIAILGEMKDLGDSSEKEHARLGTKIAKTKINLLITVGPVALTIAKSAKKSGFGGTAFNADSTDKILKYLKKYSDKKRVVLVKGSRHTHLERIVYGLQGKSTAISCYHCGQLA
jgi:UDP-N-acetylmuramoyl-tripeptide--D-alanyl-D-alanine ligase